MNHDHRKKKIAVVNQPTVSSRGQPTKQPQVFIGHNQHHDSKWMAPHPNTPVPILMPSQGRFDLQHCLPPRIVMAYKQELWIACMAYNGIQAMIVMDWYSQLAWLYLIMTCHDYHWSPNWMTQSRDQSV